MLEHEADRISFPRVLFLDQSGELGGAELSLLDIARHFRTRATVALLADGPFAARLRDAGIVCDVLAGTAPLLSVRRQDGPTQWIHAVGAVGRSITALARLARTHDLIYANTQKSFVLGALAAMVARRRLIWHLRDILSAAHFGAANLRLTVALARMTGARVIANSQATAAAFVAAGGAVQNVATIPNGIDPAPCRTLDLEARQRLRETLGVADGPVLGIFGRLAEWKGQHILLEVVARLPGTQAIVVGDALFGEVEYRDFLMARVRELDVERRVRFLGFRDDVPALMRACDIVVHASIAPEPFGRVIVEAMLAGLPVIASDAGGAREIVENGRSGILVPPGDAEILAAAVRALLADQVRARRLALAGSERALAEFGLDRALARIEAVVAEAASPATATPHRRDSLEPRPADDIVS